MKTPDSNLVSENFSSMDLTPEILSALSSMKIDKPTDIQKKALPVGLLGSDLIGIAETGSGKTLAYALIAITKLQKDPNSRVLVLTPSRETADQVYRVLSSLIEGLSISASLVVGGMPEKKQVSQLNKLPRLIIATPGRLLELLANNKLLLQKLSVLVIDEADRMLDKGFGPQLRNIRSTLRGEIQTLMFGASFNQTALKFAQDFLRTESFLIQTEGAEKPVSNLQQTVFFLEKNSKKERLFEILNSTKGPCLVFVNDQPASESVHHHLSENGISVDVIHGAFKHGHRERVVRDFRDQKFRVLVATDLLARGLDVPNIELVINFELPVETEDFLHRIGRTARGGKKGKAITFVSRSEESNHNRLKPYLENAEEIRL